MFVFVQTLLLH